MSADKEFHKYCKKTTIPISFIVFITGFGITLMIYLLENYFNAR